jgi:hypothetical protein
MKSIHSSVWANAYPLQQFNHVQSSNAKWYICLLIIRQSCACAEALHKGGIYGGAGGRNSYSELIRDKPSDSSSARGPGTTD